ncbi:LuxR C-terminal-related transcriptional regulator [Serratia fonticola]
MPRSYLGPDCQKLQISVKTVSAHKHSAMRKLGFRNSQELYIWLLRVKNM